jgi:nucleoside-diphosphate-sugar epimerase
MEELCAKIAPTHLIHTAWTTEHGTYWHSPANATWRDQTVALAQAFARAGGHSITFAGTCAEYDWSRGLLIEDDTPDAPATPYGRAKAETSRRLMAIGKENDIAVTVGRIFHPFGAGENAKRVTSLAARALATGTPLHLNSGDVYRDLCSTRSVARCMVDLALNVDDQRVINIGSGRPTHLGTFLREILGAGHPNRELITWQDNMPDDPTNPRLLIPQTRRLEAICPPAGYTREDIDEFLNSQTGF